MAASSRWTSVCDVRRAHPGGGPRAGGGGCLTAPGRPVRLAAACAALLLQPVWGVAAEAITSTAAPVANAPLWQLSLHSERHNDALPLALMVGDSARRLAPRSGLNLAYHDDEARLSRSQGGWTWSLLARNHATLVAGQPALALAALMAQRQTPAADAQWQADVHLRAFAGAGLGIARTQALAPGWDAHWEVQALALSRWRTRDLSGPVRYSAASGQYQLGLQSQELDNRLKPPFLQDFAPHGAGLLLAGGLQWQGASAWASARVRDGGWLRWQGMPQQQALLDTATEAVDADGFLVYKPLVVGRTVQADVRRWLPWRGQVAGGAVLANGQRLGLQVDTVPGFGALPALLWQRPAAGPGSLALGALWRLHERRLTLSAAWRGASLHLGTDRLGAAAQSRELGLAYQRAF